jgi:hypothetical protein
MTTLYRPVGQREMELIAESNYKCFPPRLYWQPIFYPVLNQEYAEHIAFEWNTKDEFSGYCGIVTAFDVNDDFLSNYQIQNVGGTIHNEYWILAEDLDAFNNSIVGGIKVVNLFFGEGYKPSSNDQLNNYLNQIKNELTSN